LGDRFSRRRIVLTSLVLFSLVTFGAGLARSGTQLIALRCLLGVCEAFSLPPALAYVASFHSDLIPSLANGIRLNGLSVGAGLGSWYGGYMAELYTWRVGFCLLGICGIGTSVIAARILRKDGVLRVSPAPGLAI
jgi:MFS family permease